MQGASKTDELIALGEAAQRLGLTRSGVYGLVRRGVLHRQMTRLGFYAYDPAEVDTLAAERARLFERGPKGRPRRRRDTPEAAT